MVAPPASIEAPAPPWHALEVVDVLEELGSREEGLSETEATARLEVYGRNRLEPPRPVSALRILFDQFASVVVLLLLTATLGALFVGEALEAAAIAVVLAINATLGFVVELRARRAMEALLGYEVPWARVVRDGATTRVAADLVVPGDVIDAESGDAIPADARLLSAAEVRTVESPLTGESAPVSKKVEPAGEGRPLAERSSMLYAGTTLASGHARAVVVSTGSGTELGRIGILIEGIKEAATPLERRLDSLGKRLVWLTLGIAAVVVLSGWAQGVPLRQMIETGIALAIAAVPEGLPTVATIALAVGLSRMARRKALVRRLSAVEALGSTTVVCTDKTGTLTAGEMTAVCVAGGGMEWTVTGAGFDEEGEILEGGQVVVPKEGGTLDRILTTAVLTNRSEIDPDTGVVTGDPTDAALLTLGRKGGYEPEVLRARLPQLAEFPFSSARRLSASIHRDPQGGRGKVLVKGAPPAILDRCSMVATASGDRELDPQERLRLDAVNETWGERGQRVIALAEGNGAPGDPRALQDLTFLGLVGIIDPPAEGVRETIGLFREAGIRTVMITGDQRATARAIGRDLGLLEDSDDTLDGAELQGLDAEELVARVSEISAYSRASPEGKLKIVTALQQRGEIVGMLGDGVNDAAALKKADVGVAMGGRGTDVAKQTASVVLQDDRFSTIAVAIEEGRVIFDNIRKFVFYLFSCNLAEIMVLLGSSLAGLPLPLLPLQILWLNLVTDTFPALALALEPGEPGVMQRPPRDPDTGIMSRRFIVSLFFFATLITLATLGTYVWALETGRGDRAVTISFMTLALAQLFHLGNARSRGPVLAPARAFANRWAVAAVPLVLSLQLAAAYWPPLTSVLQTVALDPIDWVVIVAASMVPAIVGQGLELAQQRRRRILGAQAG